MKRPAPFDIAIIGWGTRGKWQFTLEQIAALEAARDVVVSPSATEDIYELLRSLKLRIHDVDTIYHEGADRLKAYYGIAEKVLTLGQKEGRTAFIQFGHPLIYSKPSEIIIRESKKQNLNTIIYPGISSIDQILCLLNLDIRNRDVQIFHGQHLYEKNKNINPYVDLFLLQAGFLGEKKYHGSIAERPKHIKLPLFKKLQSHLEKFYPPNHQMLVIALNDSFLNSDVIIKAKIKELVKLAPRLHHGHTIFIKAIQKR